MDLDRRSLLASAAALGIIPTIARAQRLIPQRPSRRVIVDNDFAGDPDGLIALAHQLLTPKARTVLVTTTALNPKFAQFSPPRPAAAGRELALQLIQLARIADAPKVIAGPETFGLQPTDAARAIVAEALRDDKLPLFVTCGGPLTNVAAALKLEPRIASRMTLVWIGGGAYPAGGWEYNLATDVEAARQVIEQSRVPLWQVPQNAYRQMEFSVAEMAATLRPISPLTQWLYDRFTTPPPFVDVGGSWPLGDSPLVLLTSISAESSVSRELPARRINPDLRYGPLIPRRPIRVFERVDARLTFDDMLALFRTQAGSRAPAA
jgi:inosine-uridine nucleoside N-ribohydrolase